MQRLARGEPEGAAAQGSPLEERTEALVVALALGLLWGWWAWKSGAYFGTVFYPGAVVIGILLILLLSFAPLGFRPAGGSAIAVAALLGLAAWTLLSLLWTPTRAAAVTDAFQVLAYAAAFLVGMWLCRLLARRMVLGLVPLALAGGLAGLVAVMALWTGDDLSRYLHSDASVRFPLGYRNANAAFFLIALWPALTLAADPQVDRRVRPLLLATATLCLELAVLSQSRGSLPAAIIGAAAYMLLCPWRLRAAAYLGLAALPVLLSLPVLLDLYQQGEPISGALPLVRDAARVMVASVIGACLLGVLALGAEHRIRLSPESTHRIGRLVAVTALVVGGGAAAIYVGNRGGPIEFVDQRVQEFTDPGGTPDLRGQGARFGANVGSNRDDFWRVALADAADRPVAGGGAGSFEFTYLRERRSHETPSDPHSLEMLMLSELGLPGLLLVAAFACGAALAIVRSASLGPSAAALAAGAAGAGAYWVTHASYDWFWNYPAITAPVIALAGSACGAAALRPMAELTRRGRRVMAIAVVLILLPAVPLYLSERYTDSALAGWKADRATAYADLSAARSLNPFGVRPLLLEAEVARLSGEQERSLAALRDAVGREPENWAPHYLIGRLLAGSARGTAARKAAVAELRIARRLNPAGSEIRVVARLLRSSR